VGAHDPADDVDVVEVLFDDLVAAEPEVGVPVAVLPFDSVSPQLGLRPAACWMTGVPTQ